MEGQKRKKSTARKTAKPIAKKAKPKAKPARKPKKTVKRKPSVQVVDTSTVMPHASVSGMVQPLRVAPVTVPLSKQRAAVHPWSVSHYLIIIVSLTVMAVLAMALIAGYTQVTILDIDSLSQNTSTLTKPVTTETRFMTTSAGEMKIAIPATWELTDLTDNHVTYTNIRLPNTTIQLSVDANDTDNTFTWLQTHQPNYVNARVVESSSTVQALQGITVAATTNDNTVAVTAVYLPIQKNLGEKTIVTILAQSPSGESDTAIAQALTTITGNLIFTD